MEGKRMSAGGFAMETEWAVRALVAVAAVAVIWGLQRGGLLSSIRRRGQARAQARRYFVEGAQLLRKCRSGDKTVAVALAREAAEAAERAIALDPGDAACYILKGLAHERQGHMAEAVESFDVALSPRAVKSLSASERADALFKRAELLLAGPADPPPLDSAIADLRGSLALNKDNAKVLCLLGACYEKKGLHLEARSAFQDALGVDPATEDAKAGLSRLS